MAEKESFEAPPVAAGGKAAMFAPALPTGKPGAVLAGAGSKAPGDGGQVVQKGKLILPTAIWILIVVGGLCFLSLLSSLNKTINTLDSLIEIEQASAKLNDKQQRDIEHHLQHHHRLEHQHEADDRQHRHRHNSRFSDKSTPATSTASSWLAMPSWTSLEPAEQRPAKLSGPLLGPLDELVNSMMSSMMGGESNPPMQGSITTFVASNDDPRGLESAIGDIFRGLGEPSKQNNKQSESTGGLHLTANIDKLNLNLNGNSNDNSKANRRQPAPYALQEPQLDDLLLPLMPSMPIVELQPVQESRPNRHRHHKHKHPYHHRIKPQQQPTTDDVIIFAADASKPMQPQELLTPLGQLIQGPVNPPQPMGHQDLGDKHTFFISFDEPPMKNPQTTLRPQVGDDLLGKLKSLTDPSPPIKNPWIESLLSGMDSQTADGALKTENQPAQDPVISTLNLLFGQNATDKDVTTTTTQKPTTGLPLTISQEQKDPMAESMEQLADMMGSIFSLPSFGAIDQEPMKVEAQSRGNRDSAKSTPDAASTTTTTTSTTKTIDLELVKQGETQPPTPLVSVTESKWQSSQGETPAPALIDDAVSKWDLFLGTTAPESTTTKPVAWPSDLSTTSTTTSTTKPPASVVVVEKALATGTPPTAQAMTTAAPKNNAIVSGKSKTFLQKADDFLERNIINLRRLLI